MKIICDLMTNLLTVVDGPSFTCEIINTVRNLDNGFRKRNEIVYATTGKEKDRNKYPVNPEKFPTGDWMITEVFKLSRSDFLSESSYKEAIRTYGPLIIKTNAKRYTKIWEVKNGLYIAPTPEVILDTQFWIHNSEYKTSHGCIIIPSMVLQCTLAEICKEEILFDGEIPFKVL